MSELIVQSKSGAYSVHIGSGSLRKIIDADSVVLIDAALTPLVSGLTEKVISITANEKSKTLGTCELVITEMKKLNLNRGSTLIAIGGGFIQDIGTLAAALYMRGISWQYMPTTLMAMMDSCVGGKSSINVGDFKNLVGNFYPPKEIFIDLAFTESLDANAIACGLSEAVKICYARGPEEFLKFRTLRSEASVLNSDTGVEFISHVLSAKKWFIENDEFDTGVRQLLNFGHTFGHALEAAIKFAIPHGIAIAIGMLAAIEYDDAKAGQLEESLTTEVLDILDPVKEIIREGSLHFDSQVFERAFSGDKKHTSKSFRPVLSKNGKLEVVEVERSTEATNKATVSMKKTFVKILTL